MKRSTGVSRRRFLVGAGLAAAGPMIVRSSVLGADAPSNRVTMGFIGVGKQGMGHMTGLSRRSDVQILAVSEVQEERCQLARENLEKSSADGKGTMPADVKFYNDFRELLGRSDIDAVLIATPDHWHGVMCVAAAKAGKDIYCEKPLSLTIGEGRAIVTAIKRYGRVFQTGSQQRSSWEFRFACEMVRSGRIGDIKSVHINVGGPSKECHLPAQPIRDGVDWDLWLGPAPYRPFHAELCPPRSVDIFPHWRSYRDYSGGGMTDWGAHHYDIAQWGLGMDHSGPVEVIPPDGKDLKNLTFKYASGIEMIHGVGPGVQFNGTGGSIECNRGMLKTTPAGIMVKPIAPSEVHLYNSPNHHDDFLKAIRTRNQPICPAEIGHRTCSICHLANIAIWLGRPLKWDPAKEEFVGDAEANRWLDRPRRAPWTV